MLTEGEKGKISFVDQLRREIGPAKTTPKPTKDETIKEFVDLVDMLQLAFVGILRPPYTNSERDDLYLLAANMVND
jgi:hypothetical protein